MGLIRWWRGHEPVPRPPRAWGITVDVPAGMEDAGLVRFTLTDESGAVLGATPVPYWYLASVNDPGGRVIRAEIQEGRTR